MSKVLEVWSGDPVAGVSKEDARTRRVKLKNYFFLRVPRKFVYSEYGWVKVNTPTP